ncbi:MAG: 4-hydroxy-3-methylbut-2-enyl diphosphate reductase [Spirochaetia bacterium]|nr:4-hydroxy-3-methylbut-2-enyl diphosphate reductase [Spirochaetia bacterium]
MLVIRSKVLGYCNGVSRVIEMAQQCIDLAKEKGVAAYTIGWFIHNPNVVARFEEQGMLLIHSPKGVSPGVALIRAHGIPDTLRLEFEEAHFTLIDGTCGTVAYSQQLIRNAKDNQQVIIIGLKNHSEVVGLSGVLNSKGTIVPTIVVEGEEDLASIEHDSKKELLVVVQTTYDADIYAHLLGLLQETYKDRIVIANRLCPSTKRRHDSLLNLMNIVDAILVVGGKKSANTAALARVVEDGGLPVWHIEDKREIPQEIYRYEKVGVTAGTSTPEEDIRAIIDILEERDR